MLFTLAPTVNVMPVNSVSAGYRAKKSYHVCWSLLEDILKSSTEARVPESISEANTPSGKNDALVFVS